MALLGTKRSRTTSYHPQGNGMVERFHRQLKAALKAQPNPDAWMTTLPLILLGIRTALKQDLNSTAAEIVYGTTLRLPGEFFTPSPPNSLPDPSEFLNILKAHFRQVKPISPLPTTTNANIPQSLSTATHAFVRHDAVRKPLQPPYDGPYPIIKRTDKPKGRTDNISIDRLKPAHLDTTLDLDTSGCPRPQTHTTSPIPQPRSRNPPSPAPMTTTTRTNRSGRHVRFPTYLSHNV